MFTVAERVDFIEGEHIRVYGVKAPSGKTIHGITSSRPKLEDFVHKLNQYNASEIHLVELVYNFLLE